LGCKTKNGAKQVATGSRKRNKLNNRVGGGVGKQLPRRQKRAADCWGSRSSEPEPGGSERKKNVHQENWESAGCMVKREKTCLTRRVRRVL